MSCVRIETLYRKLHTLNENIEIKPGGIDNRSSHASYRLQFHGSFLPMEKPILEAFSELFSLADTVVTSMTDHGFLTTIVVRNIWATFVELPKDDSSMFDIDE